MSEATKGKIKQAISDLNYVPSPIARNLKSDKTKTIGVVVRDISGFNTGKVLRAIDDYCKRHQYNVFIYNTDFDPEIEKQSLQILRQMRVDGIILTSTGHNQELIHSYQQQNFPIVEFQLEYPGTRSNIVVSDYFAGAKQATEYLIKLGHQRIAFVTQPFESGDSRSQRYQGYREALALHNIEFESDWVIDWQRESGFATNPTVLINSEQPVTAMFSQHLAITMDLLKLLDSNNISIPNQVSVVGFDEIPMVDMFKVPVTVIKQDAYQIGVESAKLMLQAINAPEQAAQKVIVPCELIARDSCKLLS